MEEFKKVAFEAIKKAEEAILYYFHNLPEIQKKTDLTPVTVADKEAEEIIVSTIRGRFPNHGFLGEEFGEDNKKAEFVWIIDPIDGTKNFIHGLDFFGTVLGLEHKGEVILGVSNMPALGELLFASTEGPTTLNGKVVHVSKIENLEEAYVTFGGFNQLKDENFVKVVWSINKKVQNMRGYGDLHGYHLVAQGKADVMFEPLVKPWDISAFQIIIRQAGGKHSDFNGDTVLGPTSLATNGLLHEEVLKIIKESGQNG